MSTGSKHPPIAVVGLSALFPDSVGADGFWQNIVDATDLISDVPSSHWLIDDYYDPDPGEADKTYCKRGGFLPDIDFDPVEFGIPPKVIPATDTTQLMALVVAKQVLEDAFAADFATMDKERMSIVLGVTAGQELLIQAASRLQRPQWLAGLREHGIAEDQAQKICDRIAEKYTPWQENTFPGLLGNVVAGRIANRFDLGGTNCITDAACASSLSALSMAINELYLGHSDVVLTGGVDCFNDIFMYMCFSKTPALSRSGDCRPFAEGADGTLMGEGLGMFALKRVEDAEEDGDRIYGVIKGLGSSSDGRSLSVYAPLPEGQAKAITRAQERAGVDPSTIELVESHGTATKAGDAAEFKGLRHAFGHSDPADDASDDENSGQPWCALGSIKSQIGHTKAAAGAAGLFKVLMALHHKVLPPTIKVDKPNEKLAIDGSPFYVNTATRPWIRGSDHRRRAGISSFGFGGSNFHVVLEEYDGPGNRPGRARTINHELFVFGADRADELRRQLQALISDLDERPERREKRRQLLAFKAHQSQQNFDAQSAHRLGLVAGDLDGLCAQLEKAHQRLKSDGDTAPEEFSVPGGPVYRHATVHDGKLAFLFPGQGSQYVNMGADLAIHFDAARQVWDGAADLGFDLHRKVFPPPAFDEKTAKAQQKSVTATEIAQPAIGADSAAKLALLKALGIGAQALGGHSYGEVTALYAGGAFDEQTMLAIARKRGQLMAEAASSTSGAMTAIRAAADQVQAWLDEWDLALSLANDNSPTQVVISGPEDAIAAAEARLDEELIAFQRLPVDTAFHSPVVASARAPFAEFLKDLDINKPRCAVYANVTAAAYDTDIKETLAAQIENPVRFVEMLRAMSDDGVRTFVEVGPGSVLSGLARRCLGSDEHNFVTLDQRDKNGICAFFDALAALSTLGIDIDYSALWANYDAPQDPRLDEQSKFTVSINGANVDRPYPPPGGPSEVPPPNEATTINQTTSSNGSKTQDKTMSDDQHFTNGAAPKGPVNGHARQAADAPTTSNAHSPAPSNASPQPPANTPSANPASANAFAAYQQSLAQSHMAYLNLMEQSVAKAQMAYMQAMESSFRQWVGDPGAQPVEAPTASPNFEQPPAPQPNFEAPPAPQPNFQQTAAPQPSPHQAPAPQPNFQQSAPSPAAPNGSPTPSAAPNGSPTKPTSSDSDLESVFLAVVADKTGYPVDMLASDLALEADLGIDSIKRVEILSAVQDEVPSMTEIDPNRMASLKTLGEISEYLSDQSGSTGAAGSANGTANGAAKPTITNGPAKPQSPPKGPPQTKSPPGGADLQSVFLTVVADKTGYPVDMLASDLALEADLGIDSIKRVEILSAVQDEVPTLPEIDPNQMASLKTLGEIVDYLQDSDATAAGGNRLGKRKPSAATVTKPGCSLPRLVTAPSAGINFLRTSPLTIIDDGQGVGAALARQLASRGYPAQLSDDVDESTRQVIDLRGLGAVDSIDDALAIQRAAFQSARAVADTVETYVVAFDTGGSFGFASDSATTDLGARQWLGGLSALAKTADLEWPDAAVKAIDIATAHVSTEQVATDDVARRLAGELTGGGPQREVAFDADGQRKVVITSDAADLVDRDSTARRAIGSDDIIIASGGARGVTAGCLIELARRCQPTIILLGRTTLESEPEATKHAKTDGEIKRALIELARQHGETPRPAEIGQKTAQILKFREIRRTLRQIEAAGSVVQYLAADVRDRSALKQALDEVRQKFGAPTAIVHAAGVLADKLIAEKQDDQFDFVFQTKVDGLRALLEVTADDNITHLCAFSSVAARTGNTGQVDYAMANETLNKVVCAEARRRDLRGLSLNWGPWDGGMVDDSLRAHFKSQGVSLISLDGGAAVFADTFAADKTLSATEIVVGDGLPSAENTIRIPVNFDAISHPELAGHKVNDEVVLPAMVVARLFVDLARSLAGGESIELRHLDVLKGIQLSDFDSSPGLICQAKTNEEGRWEMALTSADGTPRYRAELGVVGGPPLNKLSTESAEKTDWTASRLYDEILFHDGKFAVIDTLDHFSAQTAQAHLKPTSKAIAADAALQLVLAQGALADGRANLPTSLDYFVDLGIADADEIILVSQIVEITGHKTVSHVDFLDGHGNLCGAIRGLEMFFFGAPLMTHRTSATRAPRRDSVPARQGKH